MKKREFADNDFICMANC